MRQMRSMLPNHKALLSFSTTRGGKVFLGKKHMADSIFDDQPAILKEALERGMEIWAIQHPHEDHSWLKELGMGHRVFRTFAEAVDAWLYYRALNPEPLEKGQASASLWKKACLWKKAPCPAGPKPLEKGSSCSW